MHRFQKLAVCLSRTDTDAGLIEYAAMVARLGTAEEVRFVHVLANEPERDDERTAGEIRAAVDPHFAGVRDSVRRSFDVLRGPLLDTLLEYAAANKIDLMFLGHRSSHPGRRSLARRLAMKVPCSVWMAPEGSPTKIERILVPIDFSEPAADAMRVAISLGNLADAECIALHSYFNEAVITFEGYDQVLRGEEEAAYQKFLRTVDTQGVNVRFLLEEGANVAHVIGRTAEREGADLLVMATRGRSRSAAILLGSVTEEMLQETRMPLLVVKHFGARIEVLEALLNRLLRPRSSLHTD